jgi:SpoIID/LytB domain protein
MRRGALGLTTAVLSSLLVTTGPGAAPASAGTVHPMPATGKVTLVGHGYGHGHGLSQHGAQGAALQGLSWQQITAFYYPGTTPSSLSRFVRVRIGADTDGNVVVGPRSRLSVVDLAARSVRRLPENGATRWRLKAVKGNRTAVAYLLGSTWKRWALLSGDGAFGAGGLPIRLYYGSTSKTYRGRLYASRPSATSTDRDTVNRLSLENYLRGVVPAEMPATWHPSAVGAQSVAARTYAAYQLQTPQGAHFDICDTTSCQVYGGFGSEHPSANAAIDATKGTILTYGGKPAFTQFSASSGGWTDAGSVPYMPAKQDPYDDWKRSDGSDGNANHDWTTSVDVATIEKRWGIVDLKSIEVVSRDGNGDWGGRIDKVILHGAAKHITVYGSDFRMALGLKSTWFTFS